MLHQNMSRFKKRERTQNWAYEEKRCLLELCRKDMKIVENKRLDSTLTALKNKAWRIIHQQFTSTFGTDRNCNRLKEQWRRMKACTRAEMIDYQHRTTRYGQVIADRKRPNPFTFEIWDFMQEAKKACKNESMDDVDYSKVKLCLEENIPDGLVIDEDVDEDISDMWDKSSQNMCEVQIKEELSTEDEQNYHLQISSRMSSEEAPTPQKRNRRNNFTNNSDETIPSLSINNVAATLDTLNMLKNQLNDSNSHFEDSNSKVDITKQYLEFQRKEHAMRMEILKLELETATYKKETAVINKRIAMQKLIMVDGAEPDEFVDI